MAKTLITPSERLTNDISNLEKIRSEVNSVNFKVKDFGEIKGKLFSYFNERSDTLAYALFAAHTLLFVHIMC